MIVTREHAAFERGDRQADAVDRDRALVHQVRIELVGTRMRSHQLSSPSAPAHRNSPVPSTWPCTMWPLSRPVGESGRSRLTREPGRRSPSCVRRSVSGARSAEKRVGAQVDRGQADAVHGDAGALGQVAAAPSSSGRAGAVAADHSTVPSSSMIPVNIQVSFDGELVRRNRVDA